MPDKLQSLSVNHAAKAIVGSGKALDRAAVLQQLGLDPHAPPDAWLAIVACGSNASALKTQDIATLVSRGTLKGADLKAVQDLAAKHNIR